MLHSMGGWPDWLVISPPAWYRDKDQETHVLRVNPVNKKDEGDQPHAAAA